MLETISLPTFPTLLDAASTTVATAHTIGSGSLAVASATPFGTLTGGATLRLTALRAADSARVHFSCTAISGNTLTVAVMDGYPDLALAVGDSVYIAVSAETLGDVFAAVLASDSVINAHASAAAPLVSPAFSGNPTAPTAASGDSSVSIATTGFVKAQGYGTGSVTSVAGRSGVVVLSTADIAGLGSAALDSASAFASAAQGALAASALQPGGNGSGLTGLLGSQISGNIAGNASSISGAITESQVTGLTAGLAALATNSLVVHLAGAETISGQKTFSLAPIQPPTALTPGGSVTWNVSTAPTATLTAGSGFTLANPSGLAAGTGGVLTITQDGTGGRVITWGSAYVFAGGTKFVLSTAAGAVDSLSWYSPDGVNVQVAGLGGFA